jgi:hypothetical protein
VRLPILIAAGLLGRVQGVPERAWPAAPLEFREPFTLVTSIRELGDGRVLVVDRQDRIVRLVDLARGTATQVGRQGGGPGEYQSPSRLLPLGGDTTLLVDPRLQRTIVIGPGGVAGDVFLDAGVLLSLPSSARMPQAVDALGRLYFTGSMMSDRGAIPAPPDSASILRFDRRVGTVDTLARIKLARPNILVDREGTKIKSVNIRKVRFAPHDDWAVASDGRLVIVRTDQYRIDYRAGNGPLIPGPRIAYRPIPVVDADREGAIVPLPKFKPPFDGPSIWLAPDGRVWVLRTTAAADSTARYDVFDEAGRVVARVALPPRTRVVGFGRTAIYVVRRDQDDLEYLGRLALPRL